MKVEDLSAYELIEKREIKDINSISYLLRHKKSGARIALLENDDENKVFYIGFRTPPKNSRGVAHILEHSVLCGSKEFPLRDPFVELVKGSLNTFINAITYSDKTMYPVASCNDKDFQNLMHVYLDAVFYPNIYTNKSIFLQEGWHYELNDEELSINGVVYNEMKGAFSSPDDVLDREVMNSLFPDTEYGVESGGDPKEIPDLTYEEFLDFHRAYYHPSNSYIYLYGDMDMAEKLTFLDEHYLSNFEAKEIDSKLHTQKPFDKTNRVVKSYPISEGEDESENTFLALNFALSDSLDRELYIAFDVLDYAILSAPGAPVKKTLVDRGIGSDIYSEYSNDIKQPIYGIVAKGVSADREQEFIDTVEEVLKDLVKNGLEEQALLAALNVFEFKYREADFGAYPKGLMYGLQMMDSWLFDDEKPFIHIEANETFATLKKRIKEGYFEGLIEKYLLNNTHKSIVVLQPSVGLQEREEEALREKLRQKKEAMSPEELKLIEEEYQAMTKYQESEDSKEDLAKLPLLKREDLKKKAPELVISERKIDDTVFLYHKLFTGDIAYMRLIFKLDTIPEEYFPYIPVLKKCIGIVDTENYTYGEFFNQINLTTGDMTAVTNQYVDSTNPEKCTVTFDIKTKVLAPNMEAAFGLMEEMLLRSKYVDEQRILEILSEAKSRVQAGMISGGHYVASSRALSYGFVSDMYGEILSGIPFFRLLCRLTEHFEEEKKDLIDKLECLTKMIFRKENLVVDLIGNDEMVPVFEQSVKKLKNMLFTDTVPVEHFIPVPEVKNEGFMCSSAIQYVCRAGNYRKNGLEYHGSLRALKVIMGYDYLWNQVRVKGGAYGCLCSFGLSGSAYFVSYRDPNLAETVDVFKKASEAIRTFEADERTMTQYVIGAFSEMDTPMTPATEGRRSMVAYFTKVSMEQIQKWRDELLETTVEDIRATADYIDSFMSDEFICVVGNTEKIRKEEKLFQITENLF